MLLISHYGNAALLMGLNPCSGSLSLDDLPTESQSRKSIWLDAPVVCFVYLFTSLMCLFVCAQANGYSSMLRLHNSLGSKTAEGQNLFDWALRISLKISSWRMVQHILSHLCKLKHSSFLRPTDLFMNIKLILSEACIDYFTYCFLRCILMLKRMWSAFGWLYPI